MGPLWYFFNGFVGRGFEWLILAAIAGAKANADKEKKFLNMGYKYIGYEKELEKKEIGQIAEE